MNALRLPGRRAVLLGGAVLALAQAPLHAQTTFLPTPNSFSGTETVHEFEGLTTGDQITTEIPGITFTMVGGGGPWVANEDMTLRPFGPQGIGTLQNWEPGTVPNPDSPDIVVDFDTPINRVGFVIKNNVNDDLVFTLYSFNGGVLVDTRTFLTNFNFNWIGLEAVHAFDQVIFDVTNTTNAAFRIDNLRYECANCDGIPPVVTIDAPSDGAVLGSNSVSVSATVTDASPVSLESSPAGVSGFLSSGGGSTMGVVNMPEGPGTLSVSATDATGNVGGDSIGLIIDTIDPGVTVLSPGSGAVFGSSPVSLTVSVSDATAANVTFGANNTMTPAGGGVVFGDVDLVEGVNTIAVTAVDEAGNTSMTSIDLVLDLSAPLVTIDSPADGSSFGVGEETVGVTATVDDLTITDIDSIPAVVMEQLPAGGGVVADSFTLVEGSNSITIRATDQLGHVSTDSITLVLDTTGPLVAVDSPGDGMAVRGTIEFDASASDVAPGTGVARVDFFVDGDLVGSQTSAPFGVSYDTTLVADGTHTLSSVAFDGEDNSSSSSIQVLVDNTLPTINVTSPAGGAVLAGTVGFDATVGDGGSGVVAITMLAAGAAPNVVDGSTTYGSPQAGASVSSVEDTTLLPDGALLFSVVATDDAGNETTANVTITVDNTAPEKGLVNPVQGDTVSGTVDILAKATDANFDYMRIYVDGMLVQTSTTSPVTIPYDTTARLDGDFQVAVEVTDLAGNQSADSALVTIDNISLSLKPKVLNLTAQVTNRTARADLVGPNLALMWPPETSDVAIAVPGGFYVRAISGTAISGNTATVWFDRDELTRSIRAGIGAGVIDPNQQLALPLIAGGGFVIGTDKVTLRY